MLIRVWFAVLEMLKCLAMENNPYEFNQFQLFDLDNKHIMHSDNMLHSLGPTMVHLKSAYLRSAHINREEK